MKKIFTYFLILNLAQTVMAQSSYNFKRLTINDGLSNNSITGLFRDSKGFMWIGTASGLNRYDGNEFKIFKHITGDSSSLPENNILKIQEDSFNNLWIYLGAKGYAIYNSKKENFIYPAQKYLKSLGTDEYPSTVYIDNNKNIWIGTGNKKLIVFNSASESFSLVIQINNKDYITDIFRRDNFLYVTCASGIIHIINTQSYKTIASINLNSFFKLPKSNTLKTFVDNLGNIFSFQETNPDGVMFYCKKENAWYKLSTQSSLYPLLSNIVKDIIQDDKNRIWISTDHGGINIIDLETKTREFPDCSSFNLRALPEKSITCLYKDNENIIWTGSYKSGVAYYSPDIFKFKHIKPVDKNSSVDFDNDINFFEEDLNGDIWIGSNDKGIMILNRYNNSHRIINKQMPNTILSNVVVSLKCDKKGRMWIGTYQGGLTLYDNGTFKQIGNSTTNALNNNSVWTIEECENGDIWIGTLGGGINIYNPTSGTIKYLTSENADIPSNYITNIKTAHDHNIIIGTAHGLCLYNTLLNKFEIISSDNKGLFHFANNNIISLCIDSRGLIWAGTREGVNIVDIKKGSLVVLNGQSGICDDVITGILEDDNKNMWISGANGLSQIIVGIDPKNGNFTFIPTVYDQKDGLQSKAFNERSVLKTSWGDLLFGGTDGFNIININNIKYNTIKPKPVFTDLFVLNKKVNPDSLFNDRVILSKSICDYDTLILDYNQNSFTIKFSALNFHQPEKTQYSYILNGFEEVPVKISGTNASANYTNLDPGEYILSVSAANNDGFWSDKPKNIVIIIKPPVWKTIPAYIIYVILISAIIAFAIIAVYKIMHSKILVEQERINADNSHKLDEMKLRFFTNISHEFRTQISLIIIPIQKLMKNVSGNDNKRNLDIVSKNAEKLLALVNQILDLRKLDMYGDKLHLTSGDIAECIKDTCMQFSEMYEKKKIKFSFASVAEHITMKFDNDKVCKIITNLLSNAYKFTPEGESIETKITFGEEKNKSVLVVSVADTGSGISAENRESVFERFFQENNQSSTSGGTGIGLHLSKEFVNLHGGTIRVEPNTPKGSVFIFTLPLQNTDQVTNTDNKPIQSYVINKPAAKTMISDADLIDIPDTCEQDEKTVNEKKTVLIVDDNDDFRSFLSDAFKSYFNILQAENGRTAFDSVIDNMPDVVITDVMMPEVDGYKLCKRIKTDLRSSHIPVILLTARAADEHVVKGFETGADDYIVKPFNLEVLLIKINKFIEQRQLIHNKISQQREINPSDISISSLDERLIQKAIACVEKNINNSDFSVETMSKDMGMSRVHLYKKLLQLTGKTPIEFIRIIRLKRAAQLLEKSQLSVSEIAYSVGFNNPKYFSRYFKEEFGMLPSVYAQKNKPN